MQYVTSIWLQHDVFCEEFLVYVEFTLLKGMPFDTAIVMNYFNRFFDIKKINSEILQLVIAK